MPSARQSCSGSGRNRAVPAVSETPDRAPSTQADRGLGQDCRDSITDKTTSQSTRRVNYTRQVAGYRQGSHPRFVAWHAARLPRHPADRHLPSRIPVAQSDGKGQGVAGFVFCAGDHAEGIGCRCRGESEGTTDETTSHLTDKTTSHSTRLPAEKHLGGHPKDDRQVAGYKPPKNGGQVAGYQTRPCDDQPKCIASLSIYYPQSAKCELSGWVCQNSCIAHSMRIGSIMQNQLRGKTNLLLQSMTRFEFFAHRLTM